MNVHVKTGDTVVILSGKDKGKKGKVLAVSPKEGKVIVEGCNMIKKHVKPRRMGEQGGIVDAEGAMYSSKVMLVCPKCGKPTRVAHKILADGTKARLFHARDLTFVSQLSEANSANAEFAKICVWSAADFASIICASRVFRCSCLTYLFRCFSH